MDFPDELPEHVDLKTPEIVSSGSADQPDWSDLRTLPGQAGDRQRCAAAWTLISATPVMNSEPLPAVS